MMKVWCRAVSAICFLCFMSLGRCGDSKELDILWDKYGDLRAEVEELKALHRKEKEDSSSEESSEIEETEEKMKKPTGGNGKTENEDNENETGYTKFPVKFRKLEIFPTGSDYRGYTMQIEAPMGTRFMCRADNRFINVPIKPTKRARKPFPNARHEVLDGIHLVTCYSLSHNFYLMLNVDMKIVASASITPYIRESNFSLSLDITSPDLGVRVHDQTENDAYRELRVDFQVKNVDELNDTKIEYSGDLVWNNGSKLGMEISNWDLNENVNLTSTVTPLDKNDTKVVLAVPISQVKGLRGTTGMYLRQEFEQLDKLQLYILLSYGLMFEGKESLLSPFRKNDIAFIKVRDLTLSENNSVHLTCEVLGNSKTSIKMFKETDNTRQRVQNTEKVVYPGIVSVVKTVENVTTDLEGRYVCRATSGDNTQEVSFNVVVYPVVKIAKSSVSKAFPIVTVDIQAVVPGNRSVITECNIGSYEGDLIFRERGDNQNQYYVVNNTAYELEAINSSWMSTLEQERNRLGYLLEEFTPFVIGFSSSVEVTDHETVKNITFTLDLETTDKPPSHIACKAFIYRVFNRDDEWTTLQID